MSITLFSVGYSLQDLTLGAVSLMESGIRCVLRTEKCAAAAYMKERGLSFETLDRFYRDNEDFSEMNEKSAAYVRDLLREGDLALGVFSPDTDALAALLRGEVDRCIPYAGNHNVFFPWMTGAQIRECPAADAVIENAQGDLIVSEINSRLSAGELKLKLLECYSPQASVYFQTNDGNVREICLEDLDRQRGKDYGHKCCLLLPERSFLEKTRFDFTDLKHVMERLRAPDGCPWDQKQDHHSLRSYLIEEAYETASAIDREDWEHAADELGDVLLQVIFQADIGKQYGTFTLGDITTAICAKMIRRHEHVFGDRRENGEAALAQRWETIKHQEQHTRSASDSMRSLADPLPALMKAEKVLKKAAVALSRSQTAEEALRTAEEKIGDLRDTLSGGKNADIEELLGNLLLACVDLVRTEGIESETCLLRATERFVDRFEMMEQMAGNDNLSLKNLTIEEIRVYWTRAMSFSGVNNALQEQQ